jgi:hypothetical protein
MYFDRLNANGESGRLASASGLGLGPRLRGNVALAERTCSEIGYRVILAELALACGEKRPGSRRYAQHLCIWTGCVTQGVGSAACTTAIRLL